MSRTTLIAALFLVALAAMGAGGVGFSGATFSAGSTNPGNAVSSGFWTAPTVAVTDPGSPLSGTVTVSATAASAAGIADVVIEVAAA